MKQSCTLSFQAMYKQYRIDYQSALKATSDRPSVHSFGTLLLWCERTKVSKSFLFLKRDFVITSICKTSQVYLKCLKATSHSVIFSGCMRACMCGINYTDPQKTARTAYFGDYSSDFCLLHPSHTWRSLSENLSLYVSHNISCWCIFQK